MQLLRGSSNILYTQSYTKSDMCTVHIDSPDRERVDRYVLSTGYTDENGQMLAMQRPSAT